MTCSPSASAKVVFATLCALGLAACDPAPMTEIMNAGELRVTLPSERAVRIFRDSAPPAEIEPRGKVRVIGVPRRLVVRTGPCEYLYALPETGLYRLVGAVNRVEIAQDGRLYLQSILRQDGSDAPLTHETQPVGWPVQPVSRTCRSG